MAAAIGVFAWPAAAADGAVVADRLVVGFKKSTAADTRERVIERAGGSVLRKLRAVHAITVKPRRGVSLERLRRALRRHSGVRYVERDFVVNASAVPDDPYFAQQYGLSGSSPGVSVSATLAWDRRTSCSKVAVLDSGVDKDHPDLRPNLWINSDETSGNGKDDDKNGIVDDYYGADMVDEKGSGLDENGHGTHVAGIIAATANNKAGVAGVCWSAKVMSVRFLDARGRGSSSASAAAIEYAVREGAKILNCSFGSSSKSTAVEDAVNYAQDKGALLVVAAGNDGQNIDKDPSYPAALPDGNILTVAASTAKDTLASFSNYGTTNVDVAAPGDGILSTWLDGKYKEQDGTSMAAPMVAGAAAMLRQENPDATYGDLRTALRTQVDTPAALAGKVKYGGRLNLARALSAIE